jgi:hypothetical protein
MLYSQHFIKKSQRTFESESISAPFLFISTQFSSSGSSTPTLQAQIPSLVTTTASPGAVTTSNKDYTIPLAIAVIAALAIAVLSFALVLFIGRKKGLNIAPQ